MKGVGSGYHLQQVAGATACPQSWRPKVCVLGEDDPPRAAGLVCLQHRHNELSGGVAAWQLLHQPALFKTDAKEFKELNSMAGPAAASTPYKMVCKTEVQPQLKSSLFTSSTEARRCLRSCRLSCSVRKSRRTSPLGHAMMPCTSARFALQQTGHITASAGQQQPDVEAWPPCSGNGMQSVDSLTGAGGLLARVVRSVSLGVMIAR